MMFVHQGIFEEQIALEPSFFPTWYAGGGGKL